ncbi:MAG: DUF4097 family beta strand repeat-containing protein, partial [Vicinamibacterales bacterium]
MRRLTAALLLAALGVPLAGCTVELNGRQEVIVRDERRLEVSGDVDLTAETFDGSIQVRTWDQAAILVEIQKRASTEQEAEQLEVRVTQDGSRIQIEAPSPRVVRREFGNDVNRSVSFVISVPQSTAVRLHSGDGSILLDGTSGAVVANTGDGNIRLSRIAGAVEAETGDGNVSVDGRLQALRIVTGDGNVSVDALQGSAVSADWEIRTGDGEVVFAGAGLNAEIDATTGDGRIRADGARESNRNRNNDSDAWRGQLGTGGPAIRIHTGDGTVQ